MSELLLLLVPALARGLITAAVLAAVLTVLRRGGPRLAGLVAAVPVTSAPALFWLGRDYGAASAASAAQAALYGTGLTALFALTYGLAALRLRRPAPCVALAGLAAAAVSWPTMGLTTTPVGAALFAVLAIALAFRFLPRRHGTATPRSADRHDFAWTLAVSAVATAALSALAPTLSARLCGLIAALPVVGLTTMVLLHRRAEPAALAAFLRAYAGGMAAKSVFLLALTLSLVPLGQAGGWALALAATLACLGLAGGWRRWRTAGPLAVPAPRPVRPSGAAITVSLPG